MSSKIYPSTVSRNVQRRESWTDATLLSVLLDYLDGRVDVDSFRDYLNERSA